MRILPTEPSQRRRLILMLVALALMAGAYYTWGRGPELVIPKTTGPAPTSNLAVTQQRGTPSARPGGRGRVEPAMPQPLKLAAIEEVPDEPAASGRNLFRFGEHPLPPAPKVTPTPPPIYTPTPTPTPPPPQVPLLLTTIMADPVTPNAPPRAYLHDKAGNTFEAVEGDIVDGRYRLLKIGTNSVVISFVDGSGQKVLYIGG